LSTSTREYEPFWSTAGCTVVGQTAEQTECVCNHLTHFGILFDATGESSQVWMLIITVADYVYVENSILCQM